MGVIENAKEIASLVKKIGDIDLYKKIVELEGEIIELTREKRLAEEKLANLTHSQTIIEKLHFDSPFYSSADGSELYCARCIEADKLAVHVAKTSDLELRRRVFYCPQCKSRFTDMRER